jgi:hypothetical protein
MMMQIVWQLWMVRGAVVLRRDGMIEVDTQSHRTTRFANHNLTWASALYCLLPPRCICWAF